MEGFFTSSGKAGQYLLHGMKKHTLDIIKEFESYVLADIEGEFHCKFVAHCH